MRLLDIIDLLNDHAVLPQEVDGFDEYAAFGLDEYGERAEGLALDVVDSAAEDVEVEVEAARAFGNDGARDFVAREGEAKQVDCVAVGMVFASLAEAVENGGRHVAGHHVADQGLRGFVLRRHEDVDDLALLDDLAVVHHDDALADLLHDLHFMCDHDDREAELLVDALEKREGGDSRLGVEGRGGLVGEKDLGVVGQGAGDADALLLAAGELGRILVGVFGEADELEKRLDLFADDVLGRADELERERDVVVDRAGAQQVEVLEDHADAAAAFAQLVFGELGEVLAVDRDGAFAWAVEKVDAAHERALAGAGAADDAEDLAGADLDRHVVEGLELPTFRRLVGLGYVVKLDHFSMCV